MDEDSEKRHYFYQPKRASVAMLAGHKSSAPEDRSSLSNPNVIAVTHIDWQVDVDFEAAILHGIATYTLEYVTSGDKVVRLDTSHLKILSVKNGKDDLSYTLHPINKEKLHLGQQLSISLPSQPSKITIQYETTKKNKNFG